MKSVETIMLEPQCETILEGRKEWRVNGLFHREGVQALIPG